VLQALQALLNRYPHAREAAKVRIAGTVEKRHLDIRRQQVAALVWLIAWKSSACCEGGGAELVARLGLPWCSAQELDAQVPAKLYEAVAMGVPTIMLAPVHSSASTEAKRVGPVAVESTDVETILRVMEDVCSSGRPTRPSRPWIRWFHYREVPVSSVRSCR